MGVTKGPTEGGSGGKRGHSSKEAWGFHDEVKDAARKRRRLEDKDAVREAVSEDHDEKSRP
ncbi:MAG TPA: hypothetical protein VM510_02880 [Caulifigura sp.]|jgi:hypothetical protein|nr:hypothetical protein [Caulifigura sp.]